MGRIERILEIAVRKEPKTTQTKLKLMALTPNRSISLDNLEISDMEFHCFQVLGLVLRNCPFKTVDDGFETVAQKLLYLK